MKGFRFIDFALVCVCYLNENCFILHECGCGIDLAFFYSILEIIRLVVVLVLPSLTFHRYVRLDGIHCMNVNDGAPRCKIV